MLIRQLYYFVSLARERHFARAAEACNIAQPTLSAAIRKLEEELQVQLVVRGKRFAGLTSEGARVLIWGRQILADYDSLLQDLTGDRKALVGTLRLGVIPAAMPSVALVTEFFTTAYPRAHVEIISLTSRAIALALDAFEIDGGITYLENEPLERVRCLPLYHERFVFIAKRDHAFSARASVTWREAAGERLCLLSEDMQNRRIINRLAQAAGIAVTPVVTSNSFLALCALLRHGDWASIVPDTFLYVFGGTPDLFAVDLIEPRQEQLMGLVLSQREPASPMAEALLDCLRNADFEIRLRQGISHLS
ncbi:LysR family transcriptional regulator [Chelatococcus asaccharovorans]|uniref:DNA-binding transcriptional LysR family regulator n=2 Tax=Chelatococcus asaccharovorans TaxID=28210 RepID=A0A2V3TX87_9HYPH|nr:LysR family transcriptional regulator [Chelatococcus asaccharovorans]MBS7705104.1 LysR family transcriptional regulator [Chelatococcus asaccharovorans]PXW53595.1 DNA-binding transcriptional LysR family regulator [Chelatococcus asaccharovorans]